MNEITKHRGPDDTGFYSDQSVTFGSNRLAILDLSSTGHQPMKYERNGREVWITYNGEVYNFREVRAELEEKGYSFRSDCDTEVVLSSYVEWGPECVNRFIGMWGFAIYDKSAQLLFLSRDRFGIKPLYYFSDDGKFIFSSEIKGILAGNVERKPNDQIVFDFLFFGLIDHTEDTFFKKIKRLLPGHNAIYDLRSKKFEVWQYENIEERIRNADTTSLPTEERFRQLFMRSLGLRLVSDVPIGSCLSGGIDSSSIVCGMRELLPGSEIRTFSLTFPGLTIDESKYQKIVAEKCACKGFQTTFSSEDLERDISDLLWTQEEPFQGLGIYGQYRLMQLAHQSGMKVLLDGQGVDEILAGYDYLSAFYFYELFRRGRIITLIKELRSYKSAPRTETLKLFLGLLMPNRIKRFVIGRNKGYLKKSFVKKNMHSLDFRFQRNSLREESVFAVRNYPLPALLRYEDKNSMRWSVESRVPFIDGSLIAFSIALPSSEKIGRGLTKLVLRRALGSMVPNEVLRRKNKLGFATPEMAIAKSGNIKSTIKGILESKSFKSRPYWNSSDVLSGLVNQTPKKQLNPFYGEDLWRVIIIEMWMRLWIDPHSLNIEPITSDNNNLQLELVQTSYLQN